MRKQKKYTTDIPKAKYLFGIKIFYSDGGHKYANLFDVFSLKLGMNIGTILGYRKMNFIERFIFRNCR